MKTSALLSLALLLAFAGCGRIGDPEPAVREVVVYTSVDQEYAEVVLKDFEARTGIRVRAIYDAEATKTTGLVNRLVAERDRPLADVFWNNEVAQIVRLKSEGVLAPWSPPASLERPGLLRDSASYWTAFGGRARVLIVNTNALMPESHPRSIHDLLADTWPAERVGMSLPLFGTAAAHAAAIHAAWGAEKAGAYYAAIARRGVRIVDGNAAVRDMVVDGRLDWGLVDNDDAEVAIRRRDPVAMILPDQDGEGAYVIPNAVGLVAGGPHPEEARVLAAYLLDAATEKRLAEAGLLLPEGLDFRRFPVDYAAQGDWFARSQEALRRLFVR